MPYERMSCGLPHNTPCRYTYVARNPKDVAVSYFHHNCAFYYKSIDWDTFYSWYVAVTVYFGSYFDHVLSWWAHKDDKNILFLKCEDMKSNLVGAITRIASFIGSDSSERVIAEVVKKTSFESMKTDPSVDYTWVSFRDKNSQPFIRKGEVGDWRNYVSQQQSDMLDDLCREKLSSSGLVSSKSDIHVSFYP